MKDFIVRNKYFLLLVILCSAAIFIFCGHYNNILIDIGREIYYPEQITKGEVLYKDLFNIYGPFSYLFNTFLYKIFGIKLSTLYFSGIISSYLIVFGTYFLARKFLSEFLSFSIGIFIIVTGICAPHIFNYTLPYSFSMLYGLVGAIYSVIALVKYEEDNNTNYFYISALLGGLCIANKYDFLFYGILLFIIAIMTKNKKIILNFITCFAFVPLICALVLFIQKLGISDIIGSVNNIKSVIHTNSLEYFYKNQGVFFNSKIIFIWIINIIKTGICFLGLTYSAKIFEKNKIIGIILFVILSLLLFFITSPTIFVFLVPLMTILMITANEKLLNNSPLLFLLLSAFCLSVKSFCAFLTLNYGNYIVPILITAFLSLLFILINKKYEKVFAIGLLVISTNILFGFSVNRTFLNGKISTPKGTIYTYETTAQTTETVISALEQSRANKSLIYPEGLIINFLSDTNSSGFYNSLLPLYCESFGIQKFIDNIENSKPDYVILNNLDMSEYGKRYIGDDYAVEIKKYLFDNYTIVDEIGEDLKYIVFKRNLD